MEKPEYVSISTEQGGNQIHGRVALNQTAQAYFAKNCGALTCLGPAYNRRGVCGMPSCSNSILQCFNPYREDSQAIAEELYGTEAMNGDSAAAATLRLEDLFEISLRKHLQEECSARQSANKEINHSKSASPIRDPSSEDEVSGE